MKTIRQNVFETNSSSTHSVTICFREGTKPTFRPYSEGNAPVVISCGYVSDSDDWKSKAALLAIYCAYEDLPERVERIEKVLTEFSGFEVTFDKNNYQHIHKLLKTDPKWEDSVQSEFNVFVNEYYGHSDVDELFSVLNKITSNDENILSFICGSGWYSVESYYDG